MLTRERAVLVVDDDPDIREALRDTLADEGFATIEANNGQAALEYLRAHPAPPLILLDWNMAPINGAQFMTAIATDPSLSRIPVVLLTADPRAPEKATSHPFAGYLVKPVPLDALFALVSQYCG
jgi:CheY-like chemotaxis protein